MKIAGMHAEDHARAFVDRGAIVVQMRAIRGAHLAQRRAGGFHDVGNAKPVADFDQFAPADDRLAARCQFVQHQQHRRGVVIDDNPRLARQPLD